VFILQMSSVVGLELCYNVGMRWFESVRSNLFVMPSAIRGVVVVFVMVGLWFGWGVDGAPGQYDLDLDVPGTPWLGARFYAHRAAAGFDGILFVSRSVACGGYGGVEGIAPGPVRVSAI